jgi:hypothetical protein
VLPMYVHHSLSLLNFGGLESLTVCPCLISVALRAGVGRTFFIGGPPTGSSTTRTAFGVSCAIGGGELALPACNAGAGPYASVPSFF